MGRAVQFAVTTILFKWDNLIKGSARKSVFARKCGSFDTRETSIWMSSTSCRSFAFQCPHRKERAYHRRPTMRRIFRQDLCQQAFVPSGFSSVARATLDGGDLAPSVYTYVYIDPEFEKARRRDRWTDARRILVEQI